jgi:hypothetical protein
MHVGTCGAGHSRLLTTRTVSADAIHDDNERMGRGGIGVIARASENSRCEKGWV